MTRSQRPEILALIPARGGSKSIPRKNLLSLGGKPLIAHSIAQALASRFVTRTIVSTDCAEIAHVAQEYGAEVPFIRPAEFAQDASLDIDVFRHALTWLRDREGYRCDCVVHLRPTGPVRRVERVDEAIEKMLRHPEADSLRSVSWPAQTPYKMWRLDGDYLEPLLGIDGMPEAHSAPRQQLPEVFWQNGYVDIIRPRAIERGSMVGERVLAFVVDEPLYELDYPESVPALEEALAAMGRPDGPSGPRNTRRHPV